MKKLAIFIFSICLLPGYISSLLAGPEALKSDDQTVALWSFTEGEGNVIHDEGIYHLDLVPYSPTGETTDWVDGKFGSALKFSGKTQLVSRDASLPPVDLSSGQVTVEAWIRPSAEASDRQLGIFQYAGYLEWGFRLAIAADGSLNWMVDGGKKEVSLGSQEKLTYGVWTHVAGTYDGTVMRIFINGELAGEKEFSEGVIQPADNAGLIIGYVGAQGAPFFVGEINALRISKVVRSEFPSP